MSLISTQLEENTTVNTNTILDKNLRKHQDTLNGTKAITKTRQIINVNKKTCTQNDCQAGANDTDDAYTKLLFLRKNG